MSEKKPVDSRRKLLKTIAVGSSAVVAGKSMPENWSKPVINSVMLPAHASTSETPPGPTPEPTTTVPSCRHLLRIEFKTGEAGQPGSPTAPNPINMQDGDTFRQTAWGYYSDAPSTPIYINQDVIWLPFNPTVAHTGTLGGLFQDSSTVTAAGVGSTTIRASLFDDCLGEFVRGEFDVNVSPDN